MRIVIETSVFHTDFRLQGIISRTILDHICRTGDSLHVPQVVINEVENKYAERIIASISEIKKPLRQLNQLRGQRIDLLSKVNVDSEVEDYKRWLAQRLDEVNAEILDYPSISHADIVRRDLSRKKPFSIEGKGYRDTLIWETILELAKREGPDIAFITDNTRDFANKDKKLHPDLLNDLTSQGFEPNRITLFTSPHDFLEKHIKPTLTKLSEIQSELSQGIYELFDLEDWIDDNVTDLMMHKEWNPRTLGFPHEYESPSVSSLQGIEEINVTDVRQLPKGEILIEVEAKLECEFDFFIDKYEYVSIDDEEAPFIWDADWNKQYMAATAMSSIWVSLLITFDPETQEVTSSEVEYLRGSEN